MNSTLTNHKVLDIVESFYTLLKLTKIDDYNLESNNRYLCLKRERTLHYDIVFEMFCENDNVIIFIAEDEYSPKLNFDKLHVFDKYDYRFEELLSRNMEPGNRCARFNLKNEELNHFLNNLEPFI